MKLRSVIFWLHLACGVVGGVVILTMSVTGVLLTYQRQMTAWADMRDYFAPPPSSDTRRMPAERLLEHVREERPELAPTTLVLRSDPQGPASLAVGQGRTIFVNSYSGDVLGEGRGQGMRDFFRHVTEWHRYMAASGETRPLGRAITGASNLAFLFIVFSGIFLWWPRTWTPAALRNITWFRGGLPSKARDFNWHNTIGFWSAIPLAVVIAGGVVISYPWATALVYRFYNEAPPAPATAAQAAGRGNGAANGAEGRTRPAATPGSRAATDEEGAGPIDAPRDWTPLESLVATAEGHMPEWRTISIALPQDTANRVVLTLDAGDGGQPQKRATLTLDRRTGDVLRWEPFESLSPGRQARTWLRFAHTGEVYGLIGQTLAGIVSLGGAVLVYTGLALAFRRFVGWRRRADVLHKFPA